MTTTTNRTEVRPVLFLSQFPAADATTNTNTPGAGLVTPDAGDVPDYSLDVIFRDQGNNRFGAKQFPGLCSATVGDLILVGMKWYAIAPCGFVPVTSDEATEWLNAEITDRSWLVRAWAADGCRVNVGSLAPF